MDFVVTQAKNMQYPFWVRGATLLQAAVNADLYILRICVSWQPGFLVLVTTFYGPSCSEDHNICNTCDIPFDNGHLSQFLCIS